VGYIRTSDGFAKYKVDGGRCSGDMNTALGNCLLMCAMIYTYVTDQNIQKFEVINDGDDAVLFVESRCVKKLCNINQWFRDLGYRMKVEKPVYILEQVEFCQAQPVLVGKHYRMVRNPYVVMSKDLCSIQGMQSKGEWEYLTTSISLSGSALSKGVPVMQAFYSSLNMGRRVKSRGPKTGMDYLALRMERGTQPVSPESRLSFCLAFSMPPTVQRQLETMFSKQVHYSVPRVERTIPALNHKILQYSLHDRYN
jgi:hypothetical protein